MQAEVARSQQVYFFGRDLAQSSRSQKLFANLGGPPKKKLCDWFFEDGNPAWQCGVSTGSPLSFCSKHVEDKDETPIPTATEGEQHRQAIWNWTYLQTPLQTLKLQ